MPSPDAHRYLDTPTPNADSGRVIDVLILAGVEGPSIYLDDYRIAGNKPWGGGEVLYEWKADLTDILRALHLSHNGSLGAP